MRSVAGAGENAARVDFEREFAVLIADHKPRRPVQASTVFVCLQKGVGTELEEMASILETEISHYLF